MKGLNFMKIIEVARNYIGENYEHFCKAFSGGCFAWCAAFVSVCGRESGADMPWSTSCNDQIAWFKSRGLWLGHVTDIKVGDIIYYDWDKIAEAKPADHVGIVVDTSNGISVIEGNYGNADNGETAVSIRKISVDYPYIFGIARPKYETTVKNETEKLIEISVKQLEKGCEGNGVKVLQTLLSAKGYSVGHCGADGDFGGDTDKAVKAYQKDNGLDVDGVVGQQTWNKLLS